MYIYTRMIKKLKIQKVSIGIEFNSATKTKETRNNILDERTFWHEIIYKTYFWQTYLPFEFLIFNLFAFYTCYAFIIHNNLSAGTQNVTGAYVIIMLVYRCLLTTCLHGKEAV